MLKLNSQIRRKMKRICFLFFSVILLYSCNQITPVDIEQFVIKKSNNINYKNYSLIKDEIVRNHIKSMTLKSKIAQMLLISVDGTCYTDSIYLYKDEYSPGGFLLFRYNVDSAEYKSIKKFTDSLKNEYTELNQIAPYIAIDHEGGDVNRLQKAMPMLPSQQYIADHYNLKDASDIYYYNAKMLEKLGINVNLAPVNEIKTNENSKFLVNRSFGDRKKVYEYGNAELWSIIKTSILPVQKHFPGNTNIDTHTGKSVIDDDFDIIKNLYIAPFNDVRNKNESAVMMSHTILDAVDSKPSCISDKTIKYFRENTEFNGLLFTDDLTMEAISKDGYPVKRAIIEAINAGVDVIMLSVTNYIRIIDSIINDVENNEELVEKVNSAVERIIDWKIKCGLIDIDVFSENPELIFGKTFNYNEEDEESFIRYYNKAENLMKQISR